MLETVAIIVGIGSTCLGILVGASSTLARAFWKLDRRLEGIDDSLAKSIFERQLERKAIESKFEMLEYQTNANRELIAHRTQRFTEEMSKLETNLKAEINEVKGFLARTTEFQIRGNRE